METTPDQLVRRHNVATVSNQNEARKARWSK